MVRQAQWALAEERDPLPAEAAGRFAAHRVDLLAPTE
jgi:hypothetical protein